MKVFISWSGEASKAIATELNEWLPMVIQNVQTFMSAESIEKGTRWGTVISKELEDTSVGIIVLTADNIKAPWINFEAGALAKSVEDGRLHSILFGIQPSDVGTPLSQFQITRFEKNDIYKLLTSINDSCGDEKLPAERLSRIHDRFWGNFEETVSEVLAAEAQHTPKTVNKPETDIASAVQEILVLARQQNQLTHAPERFLSREVVEEIVRSYSLISEDPRRRNVGNHALRKLFSAWAAMTENLTKLEIDDTDVMTAIIKCRVDFEEAFSEVMEAFNNSSDRHANSLIDDRKLYLHRKAMRAASA